MGLGPLGGLGKGGDPPEGEVFRTCNRCTNPMAPFEAWSFFAPTPKPNESAPTRAKVSVMDS